MTWSDQVSRLLTLVPYLCARDWVSVAEVAKDFGVSEKQVLADLEVLVMCGLPGGLPDDLIEIDLDVARSEGLVHLHNAPMARPLRLRRDEATSLLVAVEAVREVADAKTAAVAERVLGKLAGLVGDIGTGVSIDLSVGSDAVRDRLADAISRGDQMRLTYDGAARRETTSPVVDPVAIETRDGASYLVAWALERDDWRTYKLDRIADAEPTGQATSDHGAPPVKVGWFDESTPANVVCLTLAPEASWVAEYYPTRDVEVLPGGGIRVTLPVGDPGWLTGLLLRLGDRVLAVDPPLAATEALREAAAALSQA